jgi:formyltetrahydrofolate deformylase
MTSQPGARAILLVSCPDRPGLVAATAGFVAELGGNIVRADQHTDRDEGVFLQRIEFDQVALPRAAIESGFRPLARRFQMDWQLHLGDETSRIAILVSRHTHCVEDLLARHKAGELAGSDIELVVGNHHDAADIATFYGTRFVHLPFAPETKRQREEELLALLADHHVDLVVLARFMQILGPEVIDAYRDRIINIHHSFLPAFVGGRPYHQAHDRGVKLIGATAHYATETLDDGPIIEQDVSRVSHRDAVDDLVRKGRDLERVVLARAVRAHLEHRILTHGTKTVVFD